MALASAPWLSRHEKRVVASQDPTWPNNPVPNLNLSATVCDFPPDFFLARCFDLVVSCRVKSVTLLHMPRDQTASSALLDVYRLIRALVLEHGHDWHVEQSEASSYL